MKISDEYAELAESHTEEASYGGYEFAGTKLGYAQVYATLAMAAATKEAAAPEVQVVDADSHVIDNEMLNAIIDLTIDAAHDAAHWGEGIDTGVLKLKINRLLNNES